MANEHTPHTPPIVRTGDPERVFARSKRAVHMGALLPELMLGGLSEEDQDRVHSHLAVCPTCTAAHADWLALLDSFVAHLPHVPPRAALRDELMTRVDGFVELPRNVAPCLDALAVLFDLTYPDARALLGSLHDHAGWRPMGPPGIWVKPVTPGPRRAGSKACLLRVSAGASFPRHRHDGDEHVLVLLGGVRENNGAIRHAGELTQHAGGTEHEFVALPDELCIAAVLCERVTTSP